MNPKMVERPPHPGPLPIGSADSADAEREKRSQRLGEVVRRMVQWFNARMFRGNLTPALPRVCFFPTTLTRPAATLSRSHGRGTRGEGETLPALRQKGHCEFKGISELVAGKKFIPLKTARNQWSCWK